MFLEPWHPLGKGSLMFPYQRGSLHTDWFPSGSLYQHRVHAEKQKPSGRDSVLLGSGLSSAWPPCARTVGWQGPEHTLARAVLPMPPRPLGDPWFQVSGVPTTGRCVAFASGVRD